jgi:hypothetical protein
MVLNAIARLSSMKSAGNVLLARMPPTFPAARKTASGCLRHKAVDRLRVAQVEVGPLGENNVVILAFQPPHDGGTSHARMAGHEDTFAFQVENNRYAAHALSLT